MVYHDDERPRTPRLKQASIEAVRRQPEEYGSRFFESAIRAPGPAAAPTAAHPGEDEALRGRIRQLEAQLEQATARRDRLQELYANQTARVEKFKGAYEAIKDSPEYAAGRVLSRPLRVPSAVRRRLATRSEQAAQGPATTPATDLGPAPSAAPEAAGGPAAATAPGPAGEAPAAAELAAIKESFYRRGSVREAADRLRALAAGEGAGSLPGLDAFRRVLGAWESLMGGAPALAAPQPNHAYFPERGRVLYCAHSTGRFNSNGYSTRTAGLVKGLADRGEDITVLARPGYPWDARVSGKTPRERRTEMRIDGVNHVFNPGLSLRDQPLDEYLAAATDVFIREAVRFRAGVLHSASNHLTALPALAAARRLGVPFVYEVRGLWEVSQAAIDPRWAGSDRYGTAAELEAFVARNADRVLAITEQVAAELVRRGVDAERIAVAPNAADSARFIPGSPDRLLQRKLGLEPGQPVVGYAGSLVAYEGLELLVEAFALLRTRLPEAKLLVVGDGPVLADLKRRSAELGVDDGVVFTGRVPAKDIPRYLSLMTAAPVPRLSNAVTELVSPIKPLEAMAAGVPLVVSDVAPLLDLVGADESRGLAFPAGQPAALAERLELLHTDRRRRSDVIRRARRWVASERSWDAIAATVAAEHQAARQTRRPEGRGLAGVRIGLIADEFTTEALAPECRIVPLRVDGWRGQLDGLDALLVESAWSGNGGQWHRKVGHYGDEEAAELRSLVQECRNRGIPTLFWNKEDPVHTDRFLPTAALFDHVFTTDANCISRYWRARGPQTRTVASLPFFAQPALHHPLPTPRPYRHTVAYGGSYYGDRYPERSRQLRTLLDGAGAENVTIYDRQVNHPGSPYEFPPSLRGRVSGGLPYREMTEAYRAHPVHINVNSVNDSPTMFSRRVMEVSACGTPLLTWIGPGVPATVGDAIPTAKDTLQASLLTQLWLHNERIRIEDGWRAHRAVYRAHLAGHRLASMLRAAGLVVAAPGLPDYEAVLEAPDPAAVGDILRQTHRPVRVVVPDGTDPGLCRPLADACIEVVAARSPGRPDVLRMHLESGADRTMAEDLARASLLAPGRVLQRQDGDLDEPGHTLLADRPRAGAGSWAVPPAAPTDPGTVLALRRERTDHSSEGPRPHPAPARPAATAQGPLTVLVAGHDLKFAGGLLAELEAQGHRVLLDRWDDHASHDEQASTELLASADAVFCEWALGNVAWYSQHVHPEQRLVARFHSQELFTPVLSRARLDRVDEFLFVGELVRRAAIARFGLRPERTRVVPNAVDVAGLAGAREAGDHRFNLGLVGIVTAKKRLDLALDVLAALRLEDDRFRLFVKGREPSEYAWMARRPDEMAYYDEQYGRIATDPLLRGAVQFDGHGDDMPQWYARMGAVLSVSDFESFHLTLADGAASGAIPLSLAWPGSELVYPSEWLHDTVPELAEDYLRLLKDDAELEARRQRAGGFVRENFDSRRVLPELVERVTGRPAR